MAHLAIEFLVPSGQKSTIFQVLRGEIGEGHDGSVSRRYAPGVGHKCPRFCLLGAHG